MVLPFGKYRGCELRDVPVDYLIWLTTIDLRPALREAVETERERRFTASVRFSFSLSAEQRKVACQVIEAGRRALARKYHPDTGGDLVTMQSVNVVADVLAAQIGDASS